jgi:hypothetical protein
MPDRLAVFVTLFLTSTKASLLMSASFFRFAALLCVVAATTPAPAALVLVNPSFESNAPFENGFNTTALPGWFASSNIPIVPENFTSFYGATSGNPEFAGRDGANIAYSVARTLSTTAADRPAVAPGDVLQLTFLAAPDNSSPQTVTAQLNFFGDNTFQGAAPLAGFGELVINLPAGQGGNPGFVLYSLVATAPAGATHVGVSVSPGASNFVFDNFSITAIPEPSAIALLSLVASATGLACRRQR